MPRPEAHPSALRAAGVALGAMPELRGNGHHRMLRGSDWVILRCGERRFEYSMWNFGGSLMGAEILTWFIWGLAMSIGWTLGAWATTRVLGKLGG